jgi:hypothetical protein
VRRSARWDGVVPIYSDGTDFRPLTPEEVASVVVETGRGGDDGFDVVVWALDFSAEGRRAYEEAGATWLIMGPAPGPDWMDDAMLIAREVCPAD